MTVSKEGLYYSNFELALGDHIYLKYFIFQTIEILFKDDINICSSRPVLSV